MKRPECNAAVQRGWNIIPVNNEKRPVIHHWKPFMKRRVTPEELEDWEATIEGICGWAVLTGSLAGIVILDFDGKDGGALLAKLGLRPHIRTRSGGFHVYFRHPGWNVGTFNSKSKKNGQLIPGLDVRGDGGYAVFTGEIDGGRYQLLRSLDDLEEPAALPDDIRAYCGLDRPAESQEKPIPPKVQRVLDEKNRDDRVRSSVLLGRALDAVRSGGGRNDAGFELARELRDNRYDQGEARQVVLEFCRCCPDTNTKGEREAYTRQEALASVSSAYSMPPREPWGPSQYTSRRQDFPYTEPPPPPPSEPPPPPTGDENLDKPEFVNKSENVKHLLSKGERGIYNHVENLCRIFEHDPTWKDVLALNEMTQRPYLRGAVPWAAGHRHWKDSDDVELERWLIRNYVKFSADVISRAVLAIAEANAFHPVREYLSSLKWDGTPRIDSWLTQYCGVEQSAYTSAVGRCWLLSACARVFEPGCQADYTLVLEGGQGIRKSSVAITLGGEWFRPFTFHRDLADKEAGMKLMGAWILEFTELRAFQGSNEESVKAFLTNRSDAIRMPWGRHVLDVKRSCVFIGTTNRDDYASDPTGNRRLWPVRMTKLDLDTLKRDRGQLWAEACFYYQEGQHWWIEDENIINEAKQQQRHRHAEDPIWEEILEEWLKLRDRVTMKEVFDGPLSKEPSHSGSMRRAARVLISLGWERERDKRSRSWIRSDSVS